MSSFDPSTIHPWSRKVEGGRECFGMFVCLVFIVLVLLLFWHLWHLWHISPIPFHQTIGLSLSWKHCTQADNRQTPKITSKQMMWTTLPASKRMSNYLVHLASLYVCFQTLLFIVHSIKNKRNQKAKHSHIEIFMQKNMITPNLVIQWRNPPSIQFMKQTKLLRWPHLILREKALTQKMLRSSNNLFTCTIVAYGALSQ